jgi:hypothetical protein
VTLPSGPPMTFAARTGRRVGVAALAASLVAGLALGAAIGAGTAQDADDVARASASPAPSAPAATPTDGGATPAATEPGVPILDLGTSSTLGWPDAIIRALGPLTSADVAAVRLDAAPPGGREWYVQIDLRPRAIARIGPLMEALASQLAVLGFDEVTVSHAQDPRSYALTGPGVMAWVGGGSFRGQDTVVMILDARSLNGPRFGPVYGPAIEGLVPAQPDECWPRWQFSPTLAFQYPDPARARRLIDDELAAPGLATAARIVRALSTAGLSETSAIWGACGSWSSYLDGSPDLHRGGWYVSMRFPPFRADGSDPSGQALAALAGTLRAEGVEPRLTIVDAGYRIWAGSIEARILRAPVGSAGVNQSGWGGEDWVLLLYLPPDAVDASGHLIPPSPVPGG